MPLFRLFHWTQLLQTFPVFVRSVSFLAADGNLQGQGSTKDQDSHPYFCWMGYSVLQESQGQAILLVFFLQQGE